MVWLRHQADLHLGVVDIMGGYVNPHMDTTLIAEGKMVDQQGLVYLHLIKLN